MPTVTVTTDELQKMAAREFGRRGGRAGKGSPAKRLAAIKANKARWTKHLRRKKKVEKK